MSVRLEFATNAPHVAYLQTTRDGNGNVARIGAHVDAVIVNHPCSPPLPG